MPSAGASGAICVQRFDDSLTSCNSHYVSHFAAFFIVARAKISVVESFGYLFFFSEESGDMSQRKMALALCLVCVCVCVLMCLILALDVHLIYHLCDAAHVICARVNSFC